MRIDRQHRIRHQQDRVSIALRARGRLRRDHAIGAGLVLDDDGYLVGLAEQLADVARQRVGLSARGIADQDRDRSRWPGLCESRRRCDQRKNRYRDREKANAIEPVGRRSSCASFPDGRCLLLASTLPRPAPQYTRCYCRNELALQLGIESRRHPLSRRSS